MRCFVFAPALALVVAGIPVDAVACSVVQDQFSSVSATSPVSAMVPVPEMITVDVERGCGSNGGGGDCADLGHVTIGLAASGANVDAYGLYLTVESGAMPDYVVDPDHSARIENGVVSLVWGDGYSQPPFSATVRLQLVDADGRLGPPSEPVEIAHPGGGSCCTCATSGRNEPSVLVLGLLVAAFLVRWRVRPA